MARKTITLLECDYAGCEHQGQRLNNFTLSMGDKASELDFCDEHIGPVRAMFDMGKIKNRSGRRVGRDGLSRVKRQPPRKRTAPLREGAVKVQ